MGNGRFYIFVEGNYFIFAELSDSDSKNEIQDRQRI